MKQRRDCVTNETNALEEVVKLLKQKECELEKESEERAQVRYQIWNQLFENTAITKQSVGYSNSFPVLVSNTEEMYVKLNQEKFDFVHLSFWVLSRQ